MFLDSINKSLEIILGAAKTTNDMPVTVDYVDMTTTTTLAGGNDTTSNGITAVTILAAPAASTQRKVNGITVYNADTASKVVTIRLNNNATLRQLVTLTMNVGDTLGYTDARGWFVIDTNGNLKSTPSSNTFTSITDLGLLDISGASAGQIKFPSIQNVSADAHTLDDYVEGAWTFTDVSGANLTLTGGNSGLYTKIGRLVVINGSVTYPTTADASVAALSLPFKVTSGYFIGTALTTAGTSVAAMCVANYSSATMGFDNASAVQTKNSSLSGATIYFTVSYFV